MGRIKPRDFVRKHWLLVGIISSIFLSGIYPKLGAKGGPLRPEYTAKYVSVIAIFFLNGLSMKTESLLDSVRQVPTHSFVQLFTFFLVPCFMQVIVWVLRVVSVNEWILKGLLIVSCMPPPIPNTVILTKSAEGNDVLAVSNAILGNFLAVFISPMIILIILGYTAIVPILEPITELLLTVLLPMVFGQIVRKFVRFNSHVDFNTIAQIILLFTVYCSFCDTFSTPELGLSAADILITIPIVIVIQMCFTLVGFYAATKLDKSLNPSDVVAITFSTSHKSVTLGLPILKIIYHGYSHLSLISLPLLVYGPTQIVLGGLAVTQMKDWVRKQSRGKKIYTY